MPVCSLCKENLDKAEFTASQLKKKSERCCAACCAAEEMRKKMALNPPPAAEVLIAEAMMAEAEAEEKAQLCRVEERAGRRVLVAARAFAPGELLLREMPSLTFGAVDELLPRFLEAGPEAQAAVLEMETPSAADAAAGLERVGCPREREREAGLRRERVEARSALALQIAQGYEGSPRILELCEALLLIVDSHAHAFEGRLGLFPLASLANHSCAPSCGHSTKVGGEMRFFASQPLAAGDEVSISYLPDLFATPRAERRRTLLLQKLLFCSCTRCARDDECRGLRCARAACGGTAVRADGDDGLWACGKCEEAAADAAMGAQLEAEATLVQRIAALKQGATSTAELQAAAAAVREALSPSHYLIPRVLSLASGLSPAAPARAAAAVAALSLAALECAAAGCHSTRCARAGVTQHPASAALTGEAVTAALACASGGSADLVALAAVIASRYLPWVARQFGPADVSFKTMRAVLDKVSAKAPAPTEHSK